MASTVADIFDIFDLFLWRIFDNLIVVGHDLCMEISLWSMQVQLHYD